jgi:hypothetical protein
VLTDSEGWRGLLARAGWPAGSWRRARSGRDDHGGSDRDDLLLLIVVIVIIVDFDDDPDLDRDVVGVVVIVVLDDLEHLGCRRLRLVRISVDGGVAWLLGHSGSYVMDR